MNPELGRPYQVLERDRPELEQVNWVQVSTDYSIRFSPKFSFATCAATENHVKGHLSPESQR